MSTPWFVIEVVGRPAPQGSKDANMREVSVYLPSWRAKVREAALRWMKDNGIGPKDRPLFLGPVVVVVTFRMDHGDRYDGPPDLDKLQRSTFDALTAARVWEDDARVVAVMAWKIPAGDRPAGATIEVRRYEI
jgi:Holliday junction resolvase RusA-like endonuclease